MKVPLWSEESQSHTQHHSLEHQHQEEESPQHLTIKISVESVHLGEIETAGNPRPLLKGLRTDSLIPRNSPWTLVEGWQEKCKERLRD